MTTTIDAMRPQARTIGRAVVPLLALAVFINYVDRGNVATAAPLIKDELRLSASQLGIVLSAFYWSYTPAQILAGWLAERINAYRVLALGLATWSIATALSGLATGFIVLIALRIVLGVGESAAFPCSSKLLAMHLPHEKLGSANGLIGVGLALGPALGTLVGGLMMARLGWRPVFIIFGLVSIFWLWPWLVATRDAPSEPTVPSGNEPSFLEILMKREAWGAAFGHFASNYSFYFVVTWLPLYLVKEQGFSVTRMAEIGGLIYFVYAASALASGWFSDYWLNTGASVTLVRKTIVIASHSSVAVAMAACALGTPALSVASLFLAAIGFGLNTPSIFTIGQTLAGPRGAGKWIAMQNCVGNLAGILAPLITGFIVDKTGHFGGAFAVAAAVASSGVIAWGVVIPKVAPVNWGSVERA
jgi:MFS family permease